MTELEQKAVDIIYRDWIDHVDIIDTVRKVFALLAPIIKKAEILDNNREYLDGFYKHEAELVEKARKWDEVEEIAKKGHLCDATFSRCMLVQELLDALAGREDGDEMS